MHLLLTDRLACPRCGSGFGLVLLADRVVERRVLAGSLGCPNCRERYPVEGGFADLRPPPRRPLHDGDLAPPETPDRDESVELAALLGVTRGPGQLVLVGELAAHAAALAAMIEEIEVVGVDPRLSRMEERAGVSRIAAASVLPFHDRTVRGVALPGPVAPDRLAEAVRVLAGGGRIVVRDAEGSVARHLEESGLELVLEEAGNVVAARP